MKAVVFENTGDWTAVLRFTELDIDEPGPGEVQVKVTARPLNPSDEMFINGVYRRQPLLPQVAGLEAAGVVVKCGLAVDQSLLGQQVVFRAAGTWAELINLPASAIRTVPADIAPEIACQLALNTLTAFALLDEAAVQREQWLLVTAAGGAVARQLIQVAAQRGIRVIAVTRSDAEKAMLLRLGATAVVNSRSDDFDGQVRGIAPAGVHAAIDAVGGSLGSSLYQLMAPFGKLIVYGRLTNDPVQYFNADVIYRNLTISGFGIDAWLNTRTTAQLDALWQEIITTVKDGRLQIGYDAAFPLEDFATAIDQYRKTSGKMILL